MSPRRKIQRGEQPLRVEPTPKPPRRWGLPTVMTLATLVVLAAITVCSLMLMSHELHRRATVKDVAVLGDVRSFMTEFTSLDPFHANHYVERVWPKPRGTSPSSTTTRRTRSLSRSRGRNRRLARF